MKQKTLKILSISLMISMILCCFTGSTVSKQMTSLDAADELDQFQVYCNHSGLLGNVTEQVAAKIAQSFKPEKEILTSVQVLLGRSLLAHKPCNIAIREELDGENLAYANVSFTEIPIVDNPVNLSNLSWIDFNFDDISVNTSKTYYLVVYSDPALLLNLYAYGYTDEELYENGTLYKKSVISDVPTEWEDTTFDLCFKTFGADEGYPDLEIISIVGSIVAGQGVSVKVKNSGGANATDVVVNITITGGFLGLINKEISVTIASINVSEEIEIEATASGIGRISINVIVQGDTVIKSGFIIGRYIFVLPDFLA